MTENVELCMHEMVPAQCSICLRRNEKRVTRSASTVTSHRYLDCPVCGRSLPETKFPTDKKQVRRTDTCRDCEKFVAAQVKAGDDREEARRNARRRFGS